MDKSVHKRQLSVCWKAHDKLVRILNSKPASLGFKTKQGGYYAIASLKPVITELMMTEQLTKQEVLLALEKSHMKATEKYFDRLMYKTSWDSEQKQRRSKRKKRRKEKYISQNNFDAEILSVCRTLPHAEIDSRLIIRYWDIIGRVGYHDNSIFLATCDLLNERPVKRPPVI